MSKVSSFFDMRRVSGIAIAVLMSLLLVASITYGVTTISTNISTGGTLTVTGASTFTGAITANGAATLGDAIGDNITITGNATSSNSFRVNGGFVVNGYATTTASNGNFATQGTLTVGNSGSAITEAIFGTCNLTSAALTATTTQNFACTSATGITTSFTQVFVQATSSLVSGSGVSTDGLVYIQAASSTAADQINVQVANPAGGAASVTVSGTLNFWAVR